jgi:hypothetical protein
MDPTIANMLNQLTKAIATNTATTATNTQQIQLNLARAVNRAAKLNQQFQIMAGLTAQIAANTGGIAPAAGAAAPPVQKISKLAVFLANTFRSIGAYIAADFANALRTAKNSGFDPFNSAALAGRSIVEAISSTLRGVPISMTDMVKINQNLIGSLGGTHMVTKGMVQDMATLNSLYGISFETSGKVTSMMYRWSDGSEAIVRNTFDIAKTLGDAAGVPVGTLLQDMAKNSEIVARYGAKGAESFFRQSIALTRMGVTMKEMSGFADKLTGNFEDSLMMTARLQTIMPGLDMSQVLYASQFGTEQQVAESLQSALQGAGLRDLGELPRSIRNMISSSLGMSQEQITNLLHTIEPVQADKIPDHVQSIDKKMDRVVNLLMLVAAGLGLGAMTALGGNIFKSILGGGGGNPARLMATRGGLLGGKGGGLEAAIQSALGSVTKQSVGRGVAGATLGGLTTIAGGALSDAGYEKTGAITSALGLAGTGASIGSIFGPAGTAIGGALGGLVGLVQGISAFTKSSMNDGGLSRSVTQHQYRSNQVMQEQQRSTEQLTKAVTDLHRKPIQATTYLDGTRVSRGLMTANRYNTVNGMV